MNTRVQEKPMNTRIYLVTDGTTQRLVRAQSKAQAVRHCVRHYVATVPSSNELVALVTTGTAVEDAASEGESHE